MISIAKNEWDVQDHECIGTGEPDPKELRAAALEKRREAAGQIILLNKAYAPKVSKAAGELADAERSLKSVKEILRNAEAARLEACQKYESLIHQRDSAIGQCERTIRENPDVELQALIGRLESEIWNHQQRNSATRRFKSRMTKLENALEKAKSLAHDHTIVGMVKLEATLASVLMSGGLE